MKQIVFFILFHISLFAKGQTNEFIQIHFDKDIYLPGETIWFKSYLTHNNTSSFISTNFYIAMYDAGGKLLDQKIYPIFSGSCNGDFKISDSIQTSHIRIRAFTKAGVLYDSTNIFENRLTIYMPEKETAKDISAKENSVNMKIFAEGGNFIAGINNFLNFKAAYNDGTAVQISGVITEEPGTKIIDSFETNNFGLGKLQFTPLPSRKYVAKWKDGTGNSFITALPDVSEYGVVFHTELSKNVLHYFINKKVSKADFSTMHLLAQMEDEEMFRADINFASNNQVVSKFSVDSMPAGILQITLFDNNWIKVAQSIVYINTSVPIFPLTETSEHNLRAKGKNVIEFNFPNQALTDLSASIADINFYDEPGTNFINTNIIYNPLIGVSKQLQEEWDKNNLQAIDMIMRTHDWKKYNPQKINDYNAALYQKVDDYLSLHVEYTNGNNRLPKNEMLNLIIGDSLVGKKFFNVSPGSRNEFRKSGLIFYGNAKVYTGLVVNKENTSYLNVSLTGLEKFPTEIEPGQHYSWYKAGYKKEMNNYFDSIVYNNPGKFNAVQTIKAVVVKTRIRNPEIERILTLDKKYTSGMFSGIARGSQLNLIDDKTASAQSNVLNYILYRVPSLKLCGNGAVQYLVYTRSNSNCDIRNAIITFVNEVELPDQNGLSTMPISQIAYVKFIPGIVIGSSFTSNNGALYIYTKRGDEVETLSPTMKSFFITGYNLPSNFSYPDYSEKSSLIQPDYRTTLYWNPYLIINQNTKKIKIEYYNNDISKRLLLTIEGFDAEGKLVRIRKVIDNQ